MSILKSILEEKSEEVKSRQRELSLNDLRLLSNDMPLTRPFGHTMLQSKSPIALIAEVKQASPARGIIREEFDPVDIAKIYASSTANALSVLTDEKYFKGKLNYLIRIREAVQLPLLRKDFIIDEYQIFETRAAGADAILLIAAALSPLQLKEYLQMAQSLGMDALIEAHNESELFVALDAGARLIAINNRDLNTFQTDLGVTERLAPLCPPGTLIISESGIEDHEDVVKVHNAGARAIIVGESLLKAVDIPAKVRELMA